MEEDIEVRIVQLEAMRVASTHAYGPSPEHAAWDKMQAWAEPKGLLMNWEPLEIYGFNNPSPSPGSPNYGYEFWLAVEPRVEPEGKVEIKDFNGGLYAVARCQGTESLGRTWQRLVVWVESSRYQTAHHQWLEKHLTPMDLPEDQFIFDLYLPVAE